MKWPYAQLGPLYDVMNPTRVALVLREFYSPSLPVGGAERQALRLAGELKKIGISVTVVTGLWEWGQPRHEDIQSIPVHRHFAAWGMFNIKGIRKFGFYSYLLSLLVYLIRHRKKFDVIHCHSANSEAAIGVFAGSLVHKPVLIRPMASGAFGDLKKLEKDCSLGGTKWMQRQLGRANAVVALNQQVVDEMRELGIAEDRFYFIPNGVEMRPGSRERSYALRGPLRIVFVGRIHPQKGLPTLLRALGRLAHDEPGLSWQLSLAGTGPSEGELKALADELGIAQGVKFLGQIDPVEALLEESDCFVLPSLSEGMSNALLEAMAQGLPCIATGIPGNDSLIQHGCNGLLVSPDDDQALAEAIAALARDESLRRKLGQQAVKTVESQHSLPGVARQYGDLYAALLRGQGG